MSNRIVQSFNVTLATGILISTLAIVGCVSEEEKAARRACALDVAGAYTEIRTDAAVSTLVVTDESDKNDVKADLTRGALYDGEQPFIDRLKNTADRDAVTAALSLGVGDDALTRQLVGGQNISDDFGASSKVAVGTSLEGVPSIEGATDAKVRWDLSLEIGNGTDQLVGNLTVSFQEERPSVTSGQKDLHSESKAFPVVFARDAGVLQVEQSAECKAVVDGQ